MLLISPTARRATAVVWPPQPPADARYACATDTNTVLIPEVPARVDLWEARKQVLRRQILDASGLWPSPLRSPIAAQFGPEIKGDGYIVQSVAFETFPGLWVTGNLYRPLDIRGKIPAILNPHGHWTNGRLERSERCNAPMRCAQFARHGYIAFAWDMIGYGDNQGLPHRLGEPEDWLWGFHSFGLQLWNGLRAFDFLSTLPYVDTTRIGCTGESGGATQTLFLAAVEERIGFLAPVVMVSAHFQGGCICENAPSLRFQTCNLEIAAMAAPRPMHIVSATGDWTANTPRIEFPKLQEFYRLYGAQQLLSHYQVDAPHNFNRESRESVYTFFSHQFRNTPLHAWQTEDAFAIPPEGLLYVFPTRKPAQSDSTDILKERWHEYWRAVQRKHLTAAVTDHAAFVETYLPSLSLALGYPNKAVAELRISEHGAASVLAPQARKLLIWRSCDKAQLPALFLQPTAMPQRTAVLVSAIGKAGFFVETAEGIAPRPLLRDLLNRGYSLLLADIFLTGEHQRPFGQLGRFATPHLLTFQLTDDAERSRDILTLTVAATRLSQQMAVDLIALDRAALWAIAAFPFTSPTTRLIAAWPEGELDDIALLESLALPNLQRIGGIETLLQLALPRSLYFFGDLPEAIRERLQATANELAPSSSLLRVWHHPLTLDDGAEEWL